MMLGVSCTSVGVALVLLLVMICTLNESFRYRAKFLIFGLESLLFTIICLPFMFFNIRSWKNALIPAWLLSKSTNKVLGVKYEVRGKENIIHDSGCIVLINHQSMLDLGVLAQLWLVMERCTVISKKEILYFGPFGLAAWLWGTIFIDRRNVEESRKIVNSTCKYIRDSKMKVLFFPEGKRHSGNTLIPFKKGPFHLAITSQVPILPVIVSKYFFLNSKSKRFGSGTSYITILPPIPTKGLTKDNIQELMDKSYEAMNTVFVQTSQETLTKHMESLKND
ncbi:1-acyl-sn-glycerol-3-phosphate acyltransferase beta isoform X1 [Vespula pensylvanica]|nr:1-acyl-sn-glycerol-3-phosphate acyltransferase beta isoform X1 [Vespula pensylvanica]XP_050856598.1 1-acyl-sn-glycerol-3-phosphate acyltransferase beta isoform X1 [Vespula vulgaris]